MYQLIYVSSAIAHFARPDFMDLALHVSTKNVQLGVTGMLVFKEGNFMQVLEGDEAVVKALYDKIEKDSRHTLVSVLHQGEITIREYGGWAMTFFNSETGQYDHFSYPS